MSLPHLLLGMLAEPQSGYDLKKSFGESISHFWSAELSQIYPALARLEKEGLLSSQLVESDKGPKRKVYSRTPAGREALIEWLEEGPTVGQERLGFLTQLFFLDAIPAPARVRFMEELRDRFAGSLAELEEVEAHWRAEDPRYPDALPDCDFFPQLTLRLGLLKYRVLAEWAEECLERMRARD